LTLSLGSWTGSAASRGAVAQALTSTGSTHANAHLTHPRARRMPVSPPYWASPPNASFCSKTTDACGGGRRPHVPIGPKVSIAPGADCHLFASPPIFADGNRLVFGEGLRLVVAPLSAR